MILNERDARHEHILQVARQMMTAARTAPKGKGIDVIEVALITDEEIKLLSDKMIAMVEEHGMKFFLRDADNILHRHRFRLCHSSRYACRHTCHVLSRTGSTTPSLAERLQDGYGHSGKCVFKESVLRPETETGS